MMESSKSGIFEVSGPTHITSVNWDCADHRRSVTASLVKGVYTLERDRQKCRQGDEALAPKWWQHFNFKLVEILVDMEDGTYFGAIFEYGNINISTTTTIGTYYNNNNKNNYNNNNNSAPSHVLAFRGTLLEPGSAVRDLHLDSQVFLNGLKHDSRYQQGLRALQGLIGKQANGPASRVWLAGHSLGAAIALQTGKYMARLSCYIESYLFNPPFPSLAMEKHVKDVDNRVLRGGLHVAGSVLTSAVSLGVDKYIKSKQRRPQQEGHQVIIHDDPFLALSPWTPHIFVHPRDLISSGYIGFFECRKMLKSIGLGRVCTASAKFSVVSSITKATGTDDGEALHKVPSGVLIKNISPDHHEEAHGIHLWWMPHNYWHAQLYQYY